MPAVARAGPGPGASRASHQATPAMIRNVIVNAFIDIGSSPGPRRRRRDTSGFAAPPGILGGTGTIEAGAARRPSSGARARGAARASGGPAPLLGAGVCGGGLVPGADELR